MIEIKFRGRGGQGVVIASEILGRSFFLEGKCPQCFSVFGGERRGAPVFGFVRVHERPILLKCQIKNPDQVILFDLSLADETEVACELKPGGLILINSSSEIDLPKKMRTFKVGLIDATEIARNAGVGNTLNTAMLGAYARFTALVKVDNLIEAVRSRIPVKVDANIRALKQAYEEVKIREPEEGN